MCSFLAWLTGEDVQFVRGFTGEHESGDNGGVSATLTPDELLTTTRTVRRRLDLTRPVPMELVRECLEIALQAPSASNRQTWQWLVVTDRDLRASIGALYARAAEKYLASPGAAGKLFADDPERAPVQRRVGASVAYLGKHMGEVPVLVIPALRLGGSGRLPSGSQAGLWGSVLPAAWSYMLAARARGLGAAWTTLHLTHEREIAELLGLPDGVHQAALIPTAYYTGAQFRPAHRVPLDSVLHVNGW
jgi:nitroreductase